MGGVTSVVAESGLGADGVDGADHGLYLATMRRSDHVAGQLRSTACGTRAGATASSGGWIATSLVSVRLIVSSTLWVACGTEDRLIDINRKFREWLKSKDVAHTDIETPGMHTWMVWRRNLADYASLLFHK